MMAGRFIINSPAHLMADSRIISPAPQQFPEIRSCTILKTWFEISLRCQSHPVTRITELMRDGIDKSDLPFKSGKRTYTAGPFPNLPAQSAASPNLFLIYCKPALR